MLVTVTNLHGRITDKLKYYKYLEEGLIRIWRMKADCIIPLVLCTAVVNSKKLRERLKMFNLFKPTGHVMHQQFNIQEF